MTSSYAGSSVIHNWLSLLNHALNGDTANVADRSIIDAGESGMVVVILVEAKFHLTGCSSLLVAELVAIDPTSCIQPSKRAST